MTEVITTNKSQTIKDSTKPHFFISLITLQANSYSSDTSEINFTFQLTSEKFLSQPQNLPTQSTR